MQKTPFKTRIDFKEDAKEALQGYWVKESFILLLVGIINFAMVMLVSRIPFIGFILAPLITIPLTFGYIRRIMSLAQGEENPIEDLLYFYQLEYLPSTLILSILASVQIFLFSLLLVVPGIIASFRYALYLHLKNDHPELSAREILSLSSKMMQGYKMDYFILHLSFIGWNILAGLTVIGLFPLYLYQQTTIAHFYSYLKEVNGYDVGGGKPKNEPRNRFDDTDNDTDFDNDSDNDENKIKINIL